MNTFSNALKKAGALTLEMKLYEMKIKDNYRKKRVLSVGVGLLLRQILVLCV